MTEIEVQKIVVDTVTPLLERAAEANRKKLEVLLKQLFNPEPSAKEQAELERERAANLRARELRDINLKYTQDRCDHMQGMDSYVLTGPVSTVQWHRYNTAAGVLGEPQGLCKKCGRVFLPTDSDYSFQRMNRKTISTAGVPFVPTAQELEERRAWEKTCAEWRAAGMEWRMD